MDKKLYQYYLALCIMILFWIIVQLLTFKTGVPVSLMPIYSFLVNFNMIFFILLPAFVIISLILTFKKLPYGLATLIINGISAFLFYNGDAIINSIS